jgi:hypothetical protein
MFRRQFEIAAEHKYLTRLEKCTYLITAMQGRATDVLNGVPRGATYEDTLEALEDRFGDQHLATVYRNQQKNEEPGCRRILARICHSHQITGPSRLPCTTRGPHKEGGRKGVRRRGGRSALKREQLRGWVITVRTEQWERRARTITDLEEMAVRLWARQYE